MLSTVTRVTLFNVEGWRQAHGAALNSVAGEARRRRAARRIRGNPRQALWEFSENKTMSAEIGRLKCS